MEKLSINIRFNMEAISNIDPFTEGRKPPSIEVRKYLWWQRKQKEREQLLQQIREFQLIGEFDWAKRLMIQNSIQINQENDILY